MYHRCRLIQLLEKRLLPLAAALLHIVPTLPHALDVIDDKTPTLVKVDAERLGAAKIDSRRDTNRPGALVVTFVNLHNHTGRIRHGK